MIKSFANTAWNVIQFVWTFSMIASAVTLFR